MSTQEPKKIDIRDLHSEGKEKARKAYNALRRYGYWTAIIILLIVSILFATLTIGNVYKRNDITLDEIINFYQEAGHELSPEDRVIISDIIMEAFSKDEIITYNEYDDFFERIQSYNYTTQEGKMVRFDSIIFYIYTKTNQQLLSFQYIEEWRLSLIIINTILAVLTTLTFMKTGIQDGLDVDFIKAKRKELIGVSEQAARKRMYSNYYFNKVYLSRLKNRRETLLLDNGLLYDKYFDDKGILKEGVEISEDEHKVLKQVMKIKIESISYDKLVNYGNTKHDEEKFYDIKEYQLKRGTRSIVLKVIMVMMFTFVSVSLIVTAQNGKQIMLNLVSTIVAFVAGFLQYLNSYTFITDEYSVTLDTKIRELKAFNEWEVPQHLIDLHNRVEFIEEELTVSEEEKIDQETIIEETPIVIGEPILIEKGVGNNEV